MSTVTVSSSSQKLRKLPYKFTHEPNVTEGKRLRHTSSTTNKPISSWHIYLSLNFNMSSLNVLHITRGSPATTAAARVAYRWDHKQSKGSPSEWDSCHPRMATHHTASQSGGGRKGPDLWINQHIWEGGKKINFLLHKEKYLFFYFIFLLIYFFEQAHSGRCFLWDVKLASFLTVFILLLLVCGLKEILFLL